ncbi:MAG: hypothetical protein QX199_19860 [Methylococcaceae bacterium]
MGKCKFASFFTLSIIIFLGMSFLSSSLLAASLPSSRDVQIDAGLSRTIEIPIENTAESSETVEISLMSARFIDGQDQPELAVLNNDVRSWVSLPRTSLDLLPHQTASVLLTVSPPIGARNETVTIAVVATEKLSGQISLNHGSATLVFVTVGDQKAMGKCVSFDVSTPSISPLAGGGPDGSGAKITMTNAGQGILVADGNIVLRGPFGLRIAQSNINPSRHRVLSNQTRSWNVDLLPLPWWAVGSFTLGIEDENFSINSCKPLPAGSRWWPLMVAGGIIATGAGLISALHRRKRVRS